VAQQRTRLTEGPKPGNRRLGATPGRRFALALLVCLGLLALPAGAAADDSAPLVQATVYTAGGGPEPDSVTPAQLRASPSQCPTYSGGPMTEYGRQGPVTVTPDPRNSWTISTILACLQTPIALADVTSITVIGSDGAPMTGSGSQLTQPDLTAPSDFQDAGQTPVITALGSTSQYDRPWRGGSDLDFLDETQSTPIAINVFEGPPLKVIASASQTTVPVGSTINFGAAVTGNNGSPLTYNWNFGGGAASSDQSSPTIKFNTAGVWTVNLQVTDANGGGGGDQVTVTVNQPGTSSTPTSTGPTTTGPDKSTGTTPKAPPSTKKHKTGKQQNGTQKTGGKGTSTNGQTPTTSTSTTTTQTTTTQSTTPAAGGSGGGSSGSSGSSGSGATPTTTPTPGAGAHHRAPTAPTHHPAPLPAQGTLVRGELVSDVVPLPANQSPLVHLVSSATGAAPARQAPVSHSHIVPIAAGVLAVLVLLGFGAQRELGYDRHWRLWLRSLRIGG
jgi:PKD repeat protein